MRVWCENNQNQIILLSVDHKFTSSLPHFNERRHLPSIVYRLSTRRQYAKFISILSNEYNYQTFDANIAYSLCCEESFSDRQSIDREKLYSFQFDGCIPLNSLIDLYSALHIKIYVAADTRHQSNIWLRSWNRVYLLLGVTETLANQ